MSGAPVEGSFTAVGRSPSFRPLADTSAQLTIPFNYSLWGTFAGTVRLERSFDNGVTWLPLTALGDAIQFTAPCSEIWEEPHTGVLYSLNCTAYTSGTINFRLSA